MKKNLFLSMVFAVLSLGSIAQSIEPVKKISENYREGYFLLEGSSQELKAAMVTARTVVLDDANEYFLVRQEFDKGIFKTVARREDIRKGVFEVDSVSQIGNLVEVFLKGGSSFKEDDLNWAKVQPGQKVEVIHILGLTQYWIGHKTIDRDTPTTNGMVCMVTPTGSRPEVQEHLVPLFKGKMSRKEKRARESQLMAQR